MTVRGLARATLILLRLPLAIAAVLLLMQMRGDASLLTKALLALVAVGMLATFARGPADVKLWALYVAAFLAFAQLRAVADETGIPHSSVYPIAMDRALFFGQVPTAWLQDRLHQAGNLRFFDALSFATYVSYFAAPHVAVIAVWRLRPALLTRVVLAMLATYHAGLLVSFLLPTVPPWLAPHLGHAIHVQRLTWEFSERLLPATYDGAARVAGINEVAAMPSLHMAQTVLVALVAAHFGRRWRVAGGAYATMMGFSLIYLGEHYLVDVLAGVALAAAAWRLSASWPRPRHASAERDASADRDAAVSPAPSLPR